MFQPPHEFPDAFIDDDFLGRPFIGESVFFVAEFGDVGGGVGEDGAFVLFVVRGEEGGNGGDAVVDGFAAAALHWDELARVWC